MFLHKRCDTGRDTFALVQRLNLEFPTLQLRVMKTRWGSCTGACIYLNPRLVQAPKDCIEYVIVHELCHLKVRSHAPRFWAQVEGLFPDWREQRDWLRLNGAWLKTELDRLIADVAD